MSPRFRSVAVLLGGVGLVALGAGVAAAVFAGLVACAFFLALR